jgi:serine/threonine protein kinase
MRILSIYTQASLMGSLYPKSPSRDEETWEYSPPEIIFATHMRDDDAADGSRGHTATHRGDGLGPSYDMWSLGILILEMILGSSDIFQPSAKQLAILERSQAYRESSKELQGIINWVVVHLYRCF